MWCQLPTPPPMANLLPIKIKYLMKKKCRFTSSVKKLGLNKTNELYSVNSEALPPMISLLPLKIKYLV